MTATAVSPVIVRLSTAAPASPLISLGQTATPVGMTFGGLQSKAALQQALTGLIGPNGNFQLVQVVNSETIYERTDQGNFSCVPKALSSPTPVDVNYPYPSAQSTVSAADSPASGLNYSAQGSGYTLYELRRDFNVTMYVLFDPGLPNIASGDVELCYPAIAFNTSTARAPSGCHGSIPVPIGSISWSYTANGINTLNPQTPQGNGTAWVVAPNCGIQGRIQGTGFVAGTAYPQWQTVNVNANRSLATFTCTTKN
jgi:hypothetical protein